MSGWDTGTGDRRRPWWRRALRFTVTGLGFVAHMNAMYSGIAFDPDGLEFEAIKERGVAPTGLPGHPERLVQHVPLSAVEVVLWRDLGWVPAPPAGNA